RILNQRRARDDAELELHAMHEAMNERRHKRLHELVMQVARVSRRRDHDPGAWPLRHAAVSRGGRSSPQAHDYDRSTRPRSDSASSAALTAVPMAAMSAVVAVTGKVAIVGLSPRVTTCSAVPVPSCSDMIRTPDSRKKGAGG